MVPAWQDVSARGEAPENSRAGSLNQPDVPGRVDDKGVKRNFSRLEQLMRLHRTFIFTIGAAALLAAAACGSSGSSASNGSAAGSSTPALKIISPAPGASVTSPFTLK